MTEKHAKGLAKFINQAERAGERHAEEGGLAGAALKEMATGVKVGGRSHIQKLENSLQGINKRIKQIQNAYSIPAAEKKRLLEKANKYRDKWNKALEQMKKESK